MLYHGFIMKNITVREMPKYSLGWDYTKYMVSDFSA